MGSDRAGLLKACSYNLQLDFYLRKEGRKSPGPREKERSAMPKMWGAHVYACVLASVLKESLLTRTLCQGSAVGDKEVRVS